jgi:hypothetical protein
LLLHEQKPVIAGLCFEQRLQTTIQKPSEQNQNEKQAKNQQERIG